MSHEHAVHEHQEHGSQDHGSGGHVDHPRTADEWDERYRTADRLWTSHANPALVREVAGLKPGRALDVGSGEGADARWLADQGWNVVAVDISQVALDRAAAIDPRETITWEQVDLGVDDVPGAPYDLVTASYFHIDADRPDIAAKLVGAVAPGGTLLFVVHAPEGLAAHGIDPAAYLSPAEIAERFADQLDVQILATVDRGRPAGGTAAQQHVDDSLLKAVKV